MQKHVAKNWKPPPNKKNSVKLCGSINSNVKIFFHSAAGVQYKFGRAWSAALPDDSEQCCFVMGVKKYIFLKYSATGGHWFLYNHHCIHLLNSSAAHYPLGRKKNWGLIFSYFPSRLHQEFRYKKLVKSTVATLLSVREVRQEGSSGDARLWRSILAAFPIWWQVSRSWNNISRTFFNLRVSGVAADIDRPVSSV